MGEIMAIKGYFNLNHGFIFETKLMVICKCLKTEWEQKHTEKILLLTPHAYSLCQRFVFVGKSKDFQNRDS